MITGIGRKWPVVAKPGGMQHLSWREIGKMHGMTGGAARHLVERNGALKKANPTAKVKKPAGMEHKTWNEIGAIYGMTGASIRSQARHGTTRLGSRRKIVVRKPLGVADLTWAEIGDLVGISAGCARQRVQRGEPIGGLENPDWVSNEPEARLVRKNQKLLAWGPPA